MINREAIDQYFVVSEQEEAEVRLAALGSVIVDDVVYCIANALHFEDEYFYAHTAFPVQATLQNKTY